MNVKSTCILTWHQVGHVSRSLGLFSKNHLLDVGLTQNQETMALQMITTVDLFYFVMNRNSLKYHLAEGPVTHDLTLQ